MKKQIVALVLATTVLAACGGGSGGGSALVRDESGTMQNCNINFNARTGLGTYSCDGSLGSGTFTRADILSYDLSAGTATVSLGGHIYHVMFDPNDDPEDTASWGEWVLGREEGGISTTTIISGTPVVTTSGGVENSMETVTEGDFDVTYSYTSAVIETTTTPQTERVTTTAVTRTDTRECVVTINGFEDEATPTCN